MKRKIIEGFGWLGLLRVLTQLIVILKLAVLARILTPSEFGLFAIVTTVVNSIEAFTQTGFNYAVIYFKDDMSKYARTLLVANLLRGVVLSILILATANVISTFFNNANLYNLLLIAAIIPIISGLGNPYVILFSKHLNFHKEFLYRAFPVIVGAIASIYFGFIYKNTTGLLYGLFVGAVSELLFSYIVTRADLKEPFKFKYLVKLFSYGKWMTMGGLVSYFNTQIDNLFVGKFYGAHVLGLYDIAFKLSHIITSEITDTLAKVLFPYFSKIRKDKKLVKKYFFYSIVALSIPAGIMLIVFNIFPAVVIKLFFGSQWIAAAPLLAILSIHGFLNSVIGPSGPLFLSVGKPKILTFISSVNFLLVIICISVFSHFWGVIGVAWGMTIAYAITTFIFIYFIQMHFKKTKKGKRVAIKLNVHVSEEK